MATTALERIGSFVSYRRGSWQGTGQHNSIVLGAMGCWNDLAATGRRGPRVRVRVTGEVRARVRVSRVNNTRVGRGRVRVKHPQWLGSASEGWRDRERCTGIRIREKGDGGCCGCTGHPQ